MKLALRPRRWMYVVAGLIGCYALLGFLVLPAILRPQAEKALSEALHRPVKIGKISINPFLLKATIRDFSINEKDGPFVEFAALTVDVELASIWRRGPVVREVTLEKPQIHITRLAADRFNFSDLLEGKKEEKPKEAGPLPRFSINNIRILGGNIVFDDRHQGSHQQISDLALAIPFVSTLPDMLDNFVEPGLSGKLNGRAFALTGKTKPFEDSRETSLSFNLDHLNLPDYLAYVPLAKGITLPSGALSAKIDLIFRQSKDKQTLLLNGQAALTELQLKQNDAPIFTLPVFGVEGFALNLTQKQIDIARVYAKGGDIRAIRQRDGAINFSRLMAAAPKEPVKETAQEVKKAESPAWHVKVGAFSLEQFAVSFHDQTVPKATPIGLNNLALKVEKIDTAPESQATLDFSALTGKQGKVAINGQFVPLPFSGKWAIDLQKLDAAYSQPYFTQLLNISLASGYVGAKGELTLATEPALTGRYQGQFGLTDFHAIDKISGQDFLKWRALDFKGIDTDIAPLRIGVQEIALRDFYSRFIVNQNGRLNLQDIMVQDGKKVSVTASSVASAPVAASKEAAPLPPIKIGKIIITGGNINYSDNLIRPNFSANLTEMTGVIAGLSSDEKARATLDLRGSVDRIAPVMIAGTLNPLAKKRFIDIKASVKGYELTSASTYAAKYAGYGIDKGKLSLDLAYKIDDRKLNASNQLLLDQLTLGDKSNSPDAVGLPVKFALALLTDRRGQINVQLPIEGTLDDPDFKVGKVIWKVLVNLLEKAVTAPFDALASLVGGDASLAWAEFAPGSTTLASKDSITKLAKALNERPALKLDIAGWADPETDREGLKRAMLEDKLRTRKLALLANRGQSVDEARAAQISKAEYAQLLEDVYNREGLPKPQKNASAPADATADMEKLLLASIQITPDQLRSLALARAQTAKDALQETGIADDRLFLITPRLTPNADELKGGKPNRVQFVLK